MVAREMIRLVPFREKNVTIELPAIQALVRKRSEQVVTGKSRDVDVLIALIKIARQMDHVLQRAATPNRTGYKRARTTNAVLSEALLELGKADPHDVSLEDLCHKMLELVDAPPSTP